jgi:hypothetical protein
LKNIYRGKQVLELRETYKSAKKILTIVEKKIRNISLAAFSPVQVQPTKRPLPFSAPG